VSAATRRNREKERAINGEAARERSFGVIFENEVGSRK